MGVAAFFILKGSNAKNSSMAVKHCFDKDKQYHGDPRNGPFNI